MFVLGVKSIANLHKVHPKMILVVSRGILYTPIDFSVIEGLRLEARQADLVAKGFSKTMFSKHREQADGYAHAFDVMAVGDLNGDGKVDHQDKSLTWEREPYQKIAKAMLKAADELGVAIRWGGNFKSFFDGPHFELV